ncbi:Hypothetical predicted protein, partial [Paramuricea clavata]
MAANRSPLRCDNKICATFRVRDMPPVEAIAVVCKDIKNEIILGRQLLLKLKVLPRNFPNEIVAQVTNIKDTLEREFPETLSDLLPEKAMHGPPMKISLRDDVEAKPTRILTARQIPLARQCEADKLIEKALSNGIIER